MVSLQKLRGGRFNVRSCRVERWTQIKHMMVIKQPQNKDQIKGEVVTFDITL